MDDDDPGSGFTSGEFPLCHPQFNTFVKKMIFFNDVPFSLKER
jgi:hypothetical protein